MIFTLSSDNFGSEDFGNGVSLSAGISSLSNEGHPKCDSNWRLEVVVGLHHFNNCIVSDRFSTEMSSKPTDEEKKTFIMNAAETFRGINTDTIMRLKNTFSNDAVKVLQSMMEEIKELRDTVDTLENRVENMDADY